MINFEPCVAKTICWIRTFPFWDKMCSMCQTFSAELPKFEEKKRQENGNYLRLDTGGSCKFCGEKQDGESKRQGGASQHATPRISPTTSFSSSDSFVSNGSKFLSCYHFWYFLAEPDVHPAEAALTNYFSFTFLPLQVSIRWR